MKASLLSLSLIMACLAYSAPAMQHFTMVAGLRLPKDSITLKLLLSGLDSFLEQKEGPNRLNTYVWQPELPATSALIDEMKMIGYNDSAKDDHFFKAYLNNITLLKDSTYLLQLSYAAVMAGIPVQKAAFRLLAREEEGRFYFYSPLTRNTLAWKSKQEGKVTFHFKDTLNARKARSYAQHNDFYLKKLGRQGQQTHVYCCEDFPEVLQLTGIDYKSANTGIKVNSLSAFENNTGIVINGSFMTAAMDFDPHDMWQEKLRTVMPPEKINRPVDEGCAYLYGGSWGLSWEQVKELFKAYTQQHADADWLDLYLKGTDFKEGREPLKISYFINALIVQQIEKEKGFATVMTLLHCGKQEKGEHNYFTALEETTGITRTTFNSRIGTLIRSLR